MRDLPTSVSEVVTRSLSDLVKMLSQDQRYTNADLKIWQYLPLHMKIIC